MCGSTIRHTPRQRGQAGHRFHLAGAPSPVAAAVFRRLFAETIYPAARSAGMYTLYFGDEGWDRLVASVLEGKAPIRSVREYYVMRDTGQDCRPAPLPDGFELRIVDEALLADRSLPAWPSLREKLCSERPSVEEFLRHSFGVCLVELSEQALAGWCFSEYNCGSRCEVGIATAPVYQRRGFGTMLGRALVRAAFARGITEVGWHCFAGNLALGRHSPAHRLRQGRRLPQLLRGLRRGREPGDQRQCVSARRPLRRGRSVVRPADPAGTPPCCGGWPRRSARSRSGRLGVLVRRLHRRPP